MVASHHRLLLGLGQLGQEDEDDRSVPVRVMALARKRCKLRSVSIGGDHMYVTNCITPTPTSSTSVPSYEYSVENARTYSLISWLVVRLVGLHCQKMVGSSFGAAFARGGWVCWSRTSLQPRRNWPPPSQLGQRSLLLRTTIRLRPSPPDFLHSRARLYVMLNLDHWSDQACFFQADETKNEEEESEGGDDYTFQLLRPKMEYSNAPRPLSRMLEYGLSGITVAAGGAHTYVSHIFMCLLVLILYNLPLLNIPISFPK